jgi:PAS domain S-box-containing protein
MFPVGRIPLRVWVAGGEGTAEALSGREGDADLSLDVTAVDPETSGEGWMSRQDVGALVVDGGVRRGDQADVVEQWVAERPDVPVVLLTDGWDDDRVAEALSSGVAEVLPRRLLETDPSTVAERVASAADCERARASFRELYDNVGSIATLHDPESGEMIHANRAFCDLLGYDREDLLSMSVGDLTAEIPGYDHERAAKVVSSVTDGGDPIELEWPVSTADGTVHWIESQLCQIRVGGREVVLSTSVDVTERRRQERRYEQVFENVNDVVSLHDPWAEEVVDVNERMAELTGYSRETLLETDVGGFSVAAEGFDEERAYEIQQRVAATGETETVEWMIETAAGERRLLEANLAPATIGGEDRVLALSRDVTERREYERRLERERDRRSVLFENNPDPVLRVRFEGDEPIVREVNAAFEDVFGFSAGDVVGSSVAEAVVPEARRDEHERLREQVVQGDPVERVAPRLTADGVREFLFRVIHFGSGPDDDTTDAYVWYTDVTERRRRERTVRQLHDAAEAVQNAETPREICEATATAATEVLGLSAPTCWVDEDGDGTLAPADGGDEPRAAPGGDGRGVIAPGDPGYGAYAEREARVVDAGELSGALPADPTDGGVTGRLLLVPLGDHGLFGAAEPDGGFDDVTIDAARTLVGHAATALDRVERGRELRRSERRFRLIAERIDEVIFLSEPDFSEIFYVNSAYEEIWGEPVEALEDDPRGFIDRVDPRDREQFEAEFEAMLADIERGEPDDSYVFEHRVRPPEGTVRWVRATGYPVEPENGESRFVGTVEDVTESRELERTYREVFENVSDGLVVHDPETGEIRDVNERFCEMNGYDREEILEMGIEGYSPTDEGYTMEEARAFVRDVVEGDEPKQTEWEVETSDGETRWLEVKGTTVEVGGELRYVSIDRDVTERKRREREYEQIFDGVNDSIVIQDPETAEPLDVNQAFLDRLGYDDVEAVRRAGFEGLTASAEGFTKARARELCRRVMETGEPETVEWQQETRTGDRRWIEATVDSAVIQGEDRILSIQRDVTERRRTERRLSEVLDRIDEAILLTRADEITADAQAADYVSAGHEAIWGQSLDRIRDTYEDGILGTVHPEDRGEHEAFVERVADDIATGTTDDRYSNEYRIERLDGEVRWVESTYYPTEWDDGPPRVVVVSRDVTDRKSRERRIASFDEATDDLATADTAEGATRAAVEAAVETLNVPAVGAYLYDEDDGVLEPEVIAGPLPAAVAEDTIEPGGGPLWEGFAAGTIVAPDGGRSHPGFVGEHEDPPGELADLAAWRAIALGNHGILLVGTPEGSLQSETIQAAHVLAATLEAALNHLEGQRRLAAREEQLRRQTERAERLDRIASLTHQVEVAITDATDPDEVERAVCERLASSGPYDVAWTAGVEVGSDRLGARTVVGAPGQYVEAMDLTTAADTADPHPAVAAWQTDEVRVENSLVGDGPADDWRRHGLSEGFQSLCSIPLTYDGVTHGVLTVGSDSPNAFGDRERDVLSQLGTSIANAVAAIERRRALESDATVELEFGGSGEELPFARTAAAADCRVRLERTVARQDGSVSVFFSLEGDVPEDAAGIADRTLAGSVDVVAEDPSSLLVEVRTDDWFGSPLAEYGGVLREAVSEPSESTITVEVPRETDVRSFVGRLQDVAPTLELVAKRQHNRQDHTSAEFSDRIRSELTDRQFEVLQTALRAGYFEWPREHDGSEVAGRLDITQPTFNKHLRLAERQTFDILFGDDA